MRRYLEIGREAGFVHVDARRLRRRMREWAGDESGEMPERRGEGHCLALRGFRETGSPGGACLSAPSLRGAREAFRQLQGVGMPDAMSGFIHLLPREVPRVRLNIHDPRATDAADLGRETASRLAELLIRHPGIQLAGWRLRVEECKVTVANTRGLEAKYRRSLFALKLRLRSEGGEVTVEERRTHWNQLQPDRLLGRGVFMLGALPGGPAPRRRTVNLVFSPFAAAAVLLDFASVFRVTDEDVPVDIRFSPQVQIMDRPLLDGMPGSVPMDDEGVPARDTLLVDGGRLQGRITDLAGAAREGISASGNGFRGPGEAFPRTRFSNLCLRSSVFSLARILKEAGEGVLVTQVRLRRLAGPERIYSAHGYTFSGEELGRAVRFTMGTAFLSWFLKIERVSRESVPVWAGGISVVSPYLKTEARRRDGEWMV